MLDCWSGFSFRSRSVKQALEKVAIGRERQKERAIELRHDDPGFTAGSTQSDQPTNGLYIAPIVAQAMPNNPDPTTVQPISIGSTSTVTNHSITPTPVKIGQKNGYIINIAIIATGIALILAWIFL